MVRPTDRLLHRRREICLAIRAGTPPEVAATFAGVTGRTYYRWMARGERESSGVFRQFCQAVKKALADCEVRNVTLVQSAAATDWKAAMTLLERRFPERWGRRDRAALDPEIERAAERLSKEAGIPKEQAIKDIRDYMKGAG